MTRPHKNSETTSEKSFHEGYAEFAKTLRNWFIAYGIGAPVLLLSQNELFKRVAETQKVAQVAGFFLAGVLAQVVQAFLFKIAMWYLHIGEQDLDFKKTCRYAISDWISEAFWLDILLDLLSLGSFGAATYALFLILAK
jgi:hypothetical protein